MSERTQGQLGVDNIALQRLTAMAAKGEGRFLYLDQLQPGDCLFLSQVGAAALQLGVRIGSINPTDSGAEAVVLSDLLHTLARIDGIAWPLSSGERIAIMGSGDMTDDDTYQPGVLEAGSGFTLLRYRDRRTDSAYYSSEPLGQAIVEDPSGVRIAMWNKA